MMIVLEWLNQQWNIPDRGDHYLMEIERTVRGLFDKDAKHTKLKFAPKTPLTPEEGALTPEQLIEADKAVWRMSMRFRGDKRLRPKAPKPLSAEEKQKRRRAAK